MPVLEPLSNASFDYVPLLQVAHAYLQAESTPAGRLDDNTTVSQASKFSII